MPFGFPRPLRGEYYLERKAKRAVVDNAERTHKKEVRARDRGCRWPGCECRKLKLRTEVAHLAAKGVGGDHGERSEPENLIELCFVKHRGTPSLHSGDLKIMPRTAVGANGPCDFFQRDEAGVFQLVASERTIGISETRGR